MRWVIWARCCMAFILRMLGPFGPSSSIYRSGRRHQAAAKSLTDSWWKAPAHLLRSVVRSGIRSSSLSARPVSCPGVSHHHDVWPDWRMSGDATTAKPENKARGGAAAFSGVDLFPDGDHQSQLSSPSCSWHPFSTSSTLSSTGWRL